MTDDPRPPPSALLTIQEAMASAHVSRRTITNWMNDQRIVVIRTPHHHPRIVAASLPAADDPQIQAAQNVFASVSMHAMHRWERLNALLRAFENGAAASARLEAYEGELSPTIDAHHTHMLAMFDARLQRLEARVVRELDRLTVERLRVDLLLKQQRDVEQTALVIP